MKKLNSDAARLKYLDELADVALIKQKYIGYLYALEEVLNAQSLGKWLSIEQEAVITLYTGNVYKILNNALRDFDTMAEELKSIRRILENALDKLPNSKYNDKLMDRLIFQI